MKKSIILFASAALFALGITSCQKDESVVKFKATIERASSKTSVTNLQNTGSHTVAWVSGDAVKVFNVLNAVNHNSNQQFVFTAGEVSASNTTTFNTTDANATSLTENPSQVYVGYPSDYFDAYNQVNIPTIQTYLNNDVHKFPMYAVSDGAFSNNTTLHFYNLCGIVRIKMPIVSGKLVNKLIITTDNQKISGLFDITGSAEQLQLTPHYGSNEVTMNFQNPIDLSSTSQYFYVYLPAASYSNFKFEFHTTGNQVLEVENNASSPIVIERGIVTTIDLQTLNDPAQWRTESLPANPNYYSVSETKQVRFSSGNLQFTNPGYFDFAPTQHEVIHFIYTDVDGRDFPYHTDLFILSTESNVFGVPPINPDYDYIPTNATLPITGEFHDWGFNMNPYSDFHFGYHAELFDDYYQIPCRWRTLSSSEWNYLINERPNATRLRTFVKVQNEGGNFAGMLIFPDGFTGASGINLDFGTYHLGSEEYAAVNNLTIAQYNQLIANATFFPVTGHFSLTATTTAFDLQEADRFGTYWCCDAQNGEHKAMRFTIPLGNGGYGSFGYVAQEKPSTNNAYPAILNFFAVRLAQDAMEKTSGSWSEIPATPATPAKSRKK
ncbi:MAG: hypothetical protein MJZ67_00675 [Bacteroidales bacterium]|nr:hypothetical protein [Bacteroidales bacterium]